MKKIAMAALCSVFVATPAVADNTGKYYIAGDLGSAMYNHVTVAAGTYPSPWMVRVAGGYHFSPIWAMEVGYSMFTDSTLSNAIDSATVTASSLQIAATGTFPVNTEFDLTTKIGLAFNSHKLEGGLIGSTVRSFSASQTDLLFGIGTQFHVSPQVTLRAQCDSFGEFGKFGTTGKSMSVAAFSVGVAYTF